MKKGKSNFQTRSGSEIKQHDPKFRKALSIQKMSTSFGMMNTFLSKCSRHTSIQNLTVQVEKNMDKRESESVDGDVGYETDTPARDSGPRER